jgi:DNA-binding transcriptional LysR family regulator
VSAPNFQPNFRTLDLNLLRVFDEVMAERSLTRAARNLSLTQPAVSNALRRLRDALGDELVRRGGAGMEPTVRALALWPSVRDALRSLQASLAPGNFDPSIADHHLRAGNGRCHRSHRRSRVWSKSPEPLRPASPCGWCR